MKIELFVLPSVMRADFTDAFVLSKEDFGIVHPEWREKLAAMGADFDEWYAETYLWDKLSPDLPVVDFDTALSLLRSRTGTVLFMSESESSRKPCALVYHGRQVCDFVAMADARELADRVEYEWREFSRLFAEARCELTLPDDLYVFDTSLDWLIVFTHETVPRPDGGGERYCRAFGL
jgi:hypothetical protein